MNRWIWLLSATRKLDLTTSPSLFYTEIEKSLLKATKLTVYSLKPEITLYQMIFAFGVYVEDLH